MLNERTVFVEGSQMINSNVSLFNSEFVIKSVQFNEKLLIDRPFFLHFKYKAWFIIFFFNFRQNPIFLRKIFSRRKQRKLWSMYKSLWTSSRASSIHFKVTEATWGHSIRIATSSNPGISNLNWCLQDMTAFLSA